MSEYKEGDRVLCKRNGIQFAGTVDDFERVISDIDGTEFNLSIIIQKLTGIRTAKVGDVLVDLNGDEVKIIAITNNHQAVLRSPRGNLKATLEWLTFEELEELGLKLKDQPTEPKEMTVAEISKELGYDVKVVK